MTRLHNIKTGPHGQRGAIWIWVSLFLPVLLGFAGLAIDLARFNQVTLALQNAADAAALAGASSITGAAAPYNYSAAVGRAATIARYNSAFNKKPIREAGTVETGAVNLSLASPVFQTGQPPTSPTGFLPAVRVTYHLDSSQNGGPLRFFFGSFIGISTKNATVRAVAVRRANSAQATLVVVQ
jgi:Flp pilus assembly protein TadG